MRAVEIMEGFFFIERGYLNSNHFVFRAEAPVLIDTGYRTHFADTERRISQLGVDLHRVSLIISTHTHSDHIGGNRIIQERSGCEIALHWKGKSYMDQKDDWSTWWRYYGHDADFFSGTRPLHEGDTLCVGPHDFQVIHAPGHASDQLVLYNRQQRLLISSDALWEEDMATLTERVEGEDTLMTVQETLDKLAALDVDVVYPGHGKPFVDFEGALAQAGKRVAHYLDHREEVGNDLLKKIIVYTLMMKEGFEEERFFSYLRGTRWFVDTVDHYFEGRYQEKYQDIMKGFFKRGIVKQDKGTLFTTVKP
jgi:glyoxylase-like metal-dependent hydrolase (beta-lactamase superfamily II)